MPILKQNNSSITVRTLRCSVKVLDRLRATSKHPDIMETRGPTEEETTTRIPVEKIAQTPTQDRFISNSRTMANCGGRHNGSAGTNNAMAPNDIETKPRVPSAEKPNAKTGMTIKTFRATYKLQASGFRL